MVTVPAVVGNLTLLRSSTARVSAPDFGASFDANHQIVDSAVGATSEWTLFIGESSRCCWPQTMTRVVGKASAETMLSIITASSNDRERIIQARFYAVDDVHKVN
jgi:hypothetical protein